MSEVKPHFTVHEDDQVEQNVERTWKNTPWRDLAARSIERRKLEQEQALEEETS